MPGFRGIEKTEIDRSPVADWAREVLDAKVAPFINPIVGENRMSRFTMAPKPEGLEKFIDIGERGSAKGLEEYSEAIRGIEGRSPEKIPDSRDLVPAKESSPTFFQGLGHFFKKAFNFLLVGMGGGFGGPLMIFGGLLGGGENGRASSAIEFKDRLNEFNERMKVFDDARQALNSNTSVKLSQKRKLLRILLDPEHLELQKKREEFIRANVTWHSLDPSPIYTEDMFKEALLTRTYGSRVHFGEGEIFRNSEELIRFAKETLGYGYRGLMKPGERDQWIYATPQGEKVRVFVEVMPSEKQYGSSTPGGRVVMRLQFERPIGKNGVVRIQKGQATRYGETPFSEIGSIPFVQGPKTLTDVLFLVGGPSGQASYDLLRFIPGHYTAPLELASFWKEHAFLDDVDWINPSEFNSQTSFLNEVSGPPKTVSLRAYLDPAAEHLTREDSQWDPMKQAGFIDLIATQGVFSFYGAQVPIRVETHGIRENGEIPKYPEEVDHYVLIDFSPGSQIAINIQTKDRAIAEEIHRDFIKSYQKTGDEIDAAEWLLRKSRWAKEGLLALVPPTEPD